MNISRERKSAFLILVIIFIIIVVSMMIGFSLRTDPVAENLKDDQVIKTLLVLNDGNSNALSTDIFVYYPKSRKGALFDILGNTGQIYSSLGRVDRIDAIYREKGIGVYCEEIGRLTDMKIPFTLEITLSDFGALADLMGGLKLFVPSPVDAIHEADNCRWLLPSGAVNLDGDKIQTYIEYLLPDESQSDQEDRRQNAIVAFLSALKENRNTLLDKSNFSVYGSRITANIDSSGLYELLSHISSVDAESITTQTITGSLRNVDGKMLLFPYYDGQLIKDVVKQKIRMLINDGDEQTRVYMVEVLNGTTKQGLAHNASKLLQNTGYNILQTANADRNDYEHTVIINRIGNQDAAKVLGDFIRCYNIIEDELRPDADSGNLSEVDFTLILGSDWDGRYVRGGFGKDEQGTVSDTGASAGSAASSGAEGAGPESPPDGAGSR